MFQAGICLKQRGDLTRRAACVSHINTAMYLLQTQHTMLSGCYHCFLLSQAQISTHGTNTWISDKVVSSEHTANINSFILRESLVARRNVQLCLSSCLLSSSSSSLLEAGFPCLFCLIWSQEWLSKKERDSLCIEDGGVVYCFWRKRCRVTSCT